MVTAMPATLILGSAMQTLPLPRDQILRNQAFDCPCKQFPTDLCTCESVVETMTRIVKAFQNEPTGSCFMHLDWHKMIEPVTYALEAHGIAPPSREAYEFGVFKGGSLHSIMRAIHPVKFVAADSFQGMPKTHETSQPDFQKGHYAADPRNKLIKTYGADRLEFIAGFYNESLTNTLSQERGLNAAQYVDIDCDIYSSTYTALDWMFTQNLIKPGTVVGYDDWWVIPCNAPNPIEREASPLDVGEGLAHVEISKKHAVRFKCVAGPCLFEEQPATCSPYGTWGPIFLVEEVGNPHAASHGFEMTEQQILQWKKKGGAYGLCKHR